MSSSAREDHLAHPVAVPTEVGSSSGDGSSRPKTPLFRLDVPVRPKAPLPAGDVPVRPKAPLPAGDVPVRPKAPSATRRRGRSEDQPSSESPAAALRTATRHRACRRSRPAEAGPRPVSHRRAATDATSAGPHRGGDLQRPSSLATRAAAAGERLEPGVRPKASPGVGSDLTPSGGSLREGESPVRTLRRAAASCALGTRAPPARPPEAGRGCPGRVRSSFRSTTTGCGRRALASATGLGSPPLLRVGSPVSPSPGPCRPHRRSGQVEATLSSPGAALAARPPAARCPPRFRVGSLLRASLGVPLARRPSADRSQRRPHLRGLAPSTSVQITFGVSAADNPCPSMGCCPLRGIPTFTAAPSREGAIPFRGRGPLPSSGSKLPKLRESCCKSISPSGQVCPGGS